MQVGHALPRPERDAALRIAGDTPLDLGEGHVQMHDMPERGQVAHGRLAVDDAAARGDDRALRADGADDGTFHIQEGVAVKRLGKLLKAAAVESVEDIEGEIKYEVYMDRRISIK